MNTENEPCYDMTYLMIMCDNKYKLYIQLTIFISY